MRKVLSFVLVLSLVLGSFGMAFADYSDMAGESSAEAVDVLAGLGVISGYPDGTFRPDSIVTRAEMAKLIVAALGLEEYATATTSKYSDMGAAAWAQGFVAYGTSLGFISGYPDGTFRPNATVSYEEACSMILRALGYTSEFLPGEWPAEWVVKAKSLGILDGIKAATSAGANRGDIAEMLYNSLDLYIGYINKDGDWRPFGENTEDYDTMLVRLGAKFVEAEDAVNDGVIYGTEKSVINLRPFVGAYADRYLNKDDKIIKVVPVSEFVEGEFTSDTVFETTDGTEYKLANSITSDAIPFFVNGAYDDDAFKTDLSHESNLNKSGALAVDIDGKYITEVYSVLYWVANDAFQVSDSTLDELEDDDTLEGNEFVLDKNDEIDLNSFELIGIDELGDLEEDYVVYVYLDDAKDIRRVAVGTETAEGKVTRVASNGKVTIGSKAYDLADVEGAVKSIKLGTTGTAYLDYAGDIFAWEEEDGSIGNYALVIAVDDTADTDFDSNRVRLLLADGTKKNFNVDDKVSLDDIDAKDLVTYSVNKDGEISKITERDTLSDLEGKLSKSGAVFAGKQVDSAVVVFVLDEAGNPDDVAKLADVTRDDEFTPKYYTPEGGKIEVMIITDAQVDGGKDTVYAVINKVDAAENDDEEEVQYVYGFADGKTFEAYTDEVYFEDFDATDGPLVYELKLNADGVITKLVATYELEDILDEDMGKFVDGTVKARSASLVQLEDNAWYTLDSASVFYGFDFDKTSNPYSLKKLSDVKRDAEVVLVQIDDDSEFYDFVLVLANQPVAP